MVDFAAGIMKLLPGPHIGSRPVDEFVYGGPHRAAPDVDTCSDDAWTDHVFMRDGAPATRAEWWYHRPTGTWMVLERDTSTDTISWATGARIPARDGER